MAIVKGFLAVIAAALLIAAVGFGALFAGLLLVDRLWPGSAVSSIEPPSGFSLAVNFQGNARAVVFCWEAPPGDVTRYDLLVRHWNMGDTRDESHQGITVADCEGRACSAWAPINEGTRYWLQIPCRDAAGQGCFYRGEDGAAGGR